LSVSLALLAGLRAGEILRDAVLEPKSDYSVMLVEGQAKTRGQARVYEMPTLLEAEKIEKGYQILRETFDATELNDKELEPYKNKMRFHVSQHFAELVPTLVRLNGEKQVNLQRLRTVYDTIAVFYYCPPQVKEFVYIKAINGHDPTPGKNDAAMYYLDYQIADTVIAQYGGQRQGVKLNQPGVQIIGAIADKLKEMKKRSQAKKAATQVQQKVHKSEKAPKKTTLRVSPQVKERIVAYQKEVKAATQDEALMRYLETAQPTQKRTETEITPEGLGLTGEWIEQLSEAMSDSGETDFKSFALEAVKKEIKFRLGLRSRHEGKDFSSMPLSELKRTRHIEASNEKLRRAFLALKHHNSSVATEKLQRWYINASTLHQLVGGRFGTVT
ncbi:MAG: protelomerase family protein, partial [Microcystaceae cyanobacterium]